jgi:hypothetical protein
MDQSALPLATRHVKPLQPEGNLMSNAGEQEQSELIEVGCFRFNDNVPGWVRLRSAVVASPMDARWVLSTPIPSAAMTDEQLRTLREAIDTVLPTVPCRLATATD